MIEVQLKTLSERVDALNATIAALLELMKGGSSLPVALVPAAPAPAPADDEDEEEQPAAAPAPVKGKRGRKPKAAPAPAPADDEDEEESETPSPSQIRARQAELMSEGERKQAAKAAAVEQDELDFEEFKDKPANVTKEHALELIREVIAKGNIPGKTFDAKKAAIKEIIEKVGKANSLANCDQAGLNAVYADLQKRLPVAA